MGALQVKQIVFLSPKIKNQGEQMTTQLSNTLGAKTPKWAHFAIIAFMLAIIIGVFHEWANPDKMLIASDRVAKFGPRTIMREGLMQDGQIVQWNRGLLGGMPTGDAMIGDYLLPITFPFNYLMPAYQGQQGKLILHLFLGGLFFYLMLFKAFKFPVFIAGIGGVFYMLSPAFFSTVSPGHDAKMAVIAMLPLMVWIVKAGLDRPDLKKLVFLGIVIGFSLLTVHVQMVYFALWAIGAVWLFNGILLFQKIRHKIGDERKSEIKLLRNGTLFFWGGVFLGLMIGAPQFLVSMFFIQNAHSVRGEIDFAKATSWSLHFAEIMSLWIAEFSGWYQYYWGENFFKLNTEYIGAAAMILAVLAFVFKPSKWRIFWLALSVFIMLLAVAANSPGIRFGPNPQDVISLYMFAYNFIPGIDQFRAMGMIIFVAAFAIILLSAVALKDIWNEEWKNFSPKRLKNTKIGLLASVGVISLICLAFADKGFNFAFSDMFSANLAGNQQGNGVQICERNFTENFLPALGIWWIIATAILVSVWATVCGYLKKEIAIAIIFILGIIDMLRVGTQFVNFQSNAIYRNTPPAVAEVLRRTNIERGGAPARTMVFPEVQRVWNENIESFWGLEGVNGFHDNELVRYREFRARGGMNYFAPIFQRAQMGVADPVAEGSNTLNLAGVRYVFFFPQGASRADQLMFLENRNAMPRLAFTNSFVVKDDWQEISQTINNPAWLAHKTAILEQTPSFVSAETDGANTNITTRWIKYTPNRRIAEVQVETQGLLRISESFYPSWEVFVNGEKAQIINSDLAFMAVEIPAGTHTIEMKVDSLYMRYGLLAALPAYIFVLVVLGIAAAKKIREKKKLS